MLVTDWIQGSERDPSASAHFVTIDGAEIIDHSDELIADLARRVMEAKSSRGYLETYAARLDWDFLAQRLAAGPLALRRGDFGEVVAMGWLEDYSGLAVPVKKLRLQIRPGQSLVGTDAVAFRIQDGAIVGSHFLESKLRTTSAFITEVAVKAYKQLVDDRVGHFREILQFVHEWLFNFGHELTEPFTVYLEAHQTPDDDSHEIVLIVEEDHWDHEVLENLDEEAGELPNCTAHVLLAKSLVSLVDKTFAQIGADVIVEMDED
jgi:hypothetical protein